jgi:molybdopterin-guanine dinucleotide biosynthesis protein A
MGRDKATLEVGGVPLALRVARAAAALADPVVLVAPAGHPAADLAAGAGLTVVADPGAGPREALAAACAALTSAHVLLLGADHPDLDPALLDLLVARRAEAPAVACRRGGRLEPLVAVYERAPALALATAPDAPRSLHGLLTGLGALVLEESAWRAVDPSGRSFADLDTPGDLARRTGSS